MIWGYAGPGVFSTMTRRTTPTYLASGNVEAACWSRRMDHFCKVCLSGLVASSHAPQSWDQKHPRWTSAQPSGGTEFMFHILHCLYVHRHVFERKKNNTHTHIHTHKRAGAPIHALTMQILALPRAVVVTQRKTRHLAAVPLVVLPLLVGYKGHRGISTEL